MNTKHARLSGVDLIGYGAAILGAALFSSKPVLIKLAYADEVGPSTLLVLRMAFALPIYLIIGWLAWRRRRREGRLPGRRLLVLAALNGLLGYYLASFLDFWGLVYVTAQLERLILFTYPFFVVLLGAAFFAQPLRPRAIPALIVAYLGIAIVFARAAELTADAQDLLFGSLLVLGAALAFSCFQLIGRTLVARMGGSGLYTSVAMVSACLGVLVHGAIVDPGGPFEQTRTVYAVGAAIAIIATVLPSYLMNFALGRVGADGTAMVGNAGPIFTIALAAVALSEPFGLWDALGAGLVIAGMVYFARGDQKKFMKS